MPGERETTEGSGERVDEHLHHVVTTRNVRTLMLEYGTQLLFREDLQRATGGHHARTAPDRQYTAGT